MRASIVLALALTGCTEIVGIEDFDGPGDPIDPGETLAISGFATRNDSSTSVLALTGTPVSFHRRDGSLLATSTTDANGGYTFLIASSADTLAGYVEVSAGFDAYTPRRYVDNMTSFLSAFDVTAFLSTRLEGIATSGSATQTLSSGVVFVEVTDAAGLPVAGATVDSGGIGTLRYHDDVMGLPSFSLASTDLDGFAWIFGIAPGSVTVTAQFGASLSIDRTISVGAGTISRLRLRVP